MQEKNIEILKVSVSSVKTYDSCPLKYYYTYIEKRPKKQWDHFTLGSLTHKALEEFHKELILDSTAEHKQIMKKSFITAMKEFPNAKKNILVDSKSFLQDYLEHIKKSPTNTLKVEEGFNFNISDNVLMRGFVDRLDYENGLYHVIDYKTSKDEKYLSPFQLQAYGIWLNKEFGVEKYKASYVMLRHKSKHITYEFDLNDINKCKEEILTYAEKIIESKVIQNWVPIKSNLCYFCDYKDICPEQANLGTW